MKAIVMIAGVFFVHFVLISSAFCNGPGFSGITATTGTAETVAPNPAGIQRRICAVRGNFTSLWKEPKAC
jgi:hypothetical protein